MSSLRIVFMGTPKFAVSMLQTLLDSEHQVVGVVSQPDKKVGRKQLLQAPPVKELAVLHQIPVLQPLSISKDYDEVLALQADLIVTCAFGQMIPEVVLEAPRLGSLNIHASLLPKLRGGAPIHKSIIYGYQETGISIMRMVKQMDAGDVMLQRSLPITNNDTMGSLHDKLIEVAKIAILDAIVLLERGQAVFLKQEESQVTFAYTISKQEEILDFTKETIQVYNHIRGLIPVPVSHMMFENKKLKLHAVGGYELCTHTRMPGTLFVKDKKLMLACLGGMIQLLEVQQEGKKRVSAKDFMNGRELNGH